MNTDKIHNDLFEISRTLKELMKALTPTQMRYPGQKIECTPANMSAVANELLGLREKMHDMGDRFTVKELEYDECVLCFDGVPVSEVFPRAEMHTISYIAELVSCIISADLFPPEEANND
jgi:hypothetical protein